MGAHVSAADFECSPARAGQRHGPGLGRHLMMNSVCSCVTSKCSKPTRSSAFVSNNRIVAPTWGLFAEARRSLANYFSARGLRDFSDVGHTLEEIHIQAGLLL